ncbi:hypothetical protein CXF85_11905 [Colwellia sp. 75C3]|uniref:hypothetical protein n=1 Tax=Colwellia sp. 75C3 TaxID=888425 RepID=UPI000C328E05|nr:hypothetical protein [Colwellia sp. 75C3]PKG83044.1 hypothetical protein CXF85_11905 [Colwellia sp. 75C3]
MHLFYKYFTVNKTVAPPMLVMLLLLCLVFLNACSSSRSANELTEITILAQGENINSRPEMTEACKGFYVSTEKLKSFYLNSALTHDKQASSNKRELPCYSSGIAFLADEQIHWVLRAGGVGEFYNGQKSFTKICGISCCDSVQGVC